MLRAWGTALSALVLARPLPGNRAPAATESRPQTVKVVLLDVSESMAAVSNGIQALERARPIAVRQVEYQSNTQSNLILCAAAARPVFDRPSTNAVALVEDISRATPLPQRLH